MLIELENMCEDIAFDKKRAEELLKSINVNQEFVSTRRGLKYTFLDLAACYSNLEMVKLLLENCADPNLVYDNGSQNVLWNLQYADGIDDAENSIRLNIVKLLLENGANPHIKVEGDDLLWWAQSNWYALDEGIQAEYRWKFICLLEEYDKQGCAYEILC